jgi:hypothetical protein
VLVLGLAACGSDNRAGSTTTPQASGGETPGARETVESSPSPAGADEVVTARPGCSELCQTAGPPAGTDSPGCPGDDSDRCAPCPRGGCVELLTDHADADDGVFIVKLRCRSDDPCDGALQVLSPLEIAGQVAASDIRVPGGETADVPIALTQFGRHVVSAAGEFDGAVYVFLHGTGIDDLGNAEDGAPPLRITSARAKLNDCGGGISATANTSCPFAENVQRAVASGKMYSRVKSPTTGLSYQMDCHATETTVYCTGGNDAFVTFPQSSGG